MDRIPIGRKFQFTLGAGLGGQHAWRSPCLRVCGSNRRSACRGARRPSGSGCRPRARLRSAELLKSAAGVLVCAGLDLAVPRSSRRHLKKTVHPAEQDRADDVVDPRSLARACAASRPRQARFHLVRLRFDRTRDAVAVRCERSIAVELEVARLPDVCILL